MSSRPSIRVAFAAELIGGADVEVTNLVPPGVEPHDYELTVDDVKAVQDADVILYLGGGFQPALEAALEVRVRARRSTCSRRSDVNEYDPHVWLDPALYAQMAAVIGDVLGEPAAAERVRREARRTRRGVSRPVSSDCERRVIVTSHDRVRVSGGCVPA